MPAWVRLTEQQTSCRGPTLLAGLAHIQHCLDVGIIDPLFDDEGRSCIDDDDSVWILCSDCLDQSHLLAGQRGKRGGFRNYVACLVIDEDQRERLSFGGCSRIGDVTVGARDGKAKAHLGVGREFSCIHRERDFMPSHRWGFSTPYKRW